MPAEKVSEGENIFLYLSPSLSSLNSFRRLPLPSYDAPFVTTSLPSILIQTEVWTGMTRFVQRTCFRRNESAIVLMQCSFLVLYRRRQNNSERETARAL